MRTQTITAMLLIGLVFGGLAIAQKRQTVSPPEPKSVFIGQSLDNLAEILKQQGIEWHEGGFSFAMGDPDQSHLSFKLDEDHTLVCAHFSKSKKTITGLSIVFFPARTASFKSNQSWISATKLLLYPDTTYAVHFSKPLTLDQLREREANRPKEEFPSSNLGGAQNREKGGQQSFAPRRR